MFGGSIWGYVRCARSRRYGGYALIYVLKYIEIKKLFKTTKLTIFFKGIICEMCHNCSKLDDDDEDDDDDDDDPSDFLVV